MTFPTKTEKRRTVNMNEEVANNLNKVANRQGKTLYNLINELAEAGLEANKRDFSLKEAIETKSRFDISRKTRLLLVNQDLWYRASSIAYKKNKDEWLSKVYEKAKWYGRVFLESASKDTFSDLMKDILYNLFWDCNETSVEREEDDIFTIKAYFTPETPHQHMYVILRMIEGLLNSAGYAILRYTVEPGYLTLTFKNVPLPEEQPD